MPATDLAPARSRSIWGAADPSRTRVPHAIPCSTLDAPRSGVSALLKSSTYYSMESFAKPCGDLTIGPCPAFQVQGPDRRLAFASGRVAFAKRGYLLHDSTGCRATDPLMKGSDAFLLLRQMSDRIDKVFLLGISPTLEM
ncbi:hypothetical protein G7046_g2703 [Stylonectria norvegica]|nr:hypothetical protein G7046_g2703 [Stylonectria norvegica]